MSKNILTPEFRVSYPSVFKPKLNKLSGKQEYSIDCLFKKGEDLSKLKQAAQNAIEEKWGKDKSKWPKNLRTPFRDQADRAKENEDGKRVLPDGYVEGAIYIRLKSTRRPGVVDASVQPIIDETEFYGGCYARASVSVYAYSQMGNNGVSFGLQNLQKVRDGATFGNHVSAENEFKPLVVEGETESASDLFS